MCVMQMGVEIDGAAKSDPSNPEQAIFGRQSLHVPFKSFYTFHSSHCKSARKVVYVKQDLNFDSYHPERSTFLL